MSGSCGFRDFVVLAEDCACFAVTDHLIRILIRRIKHFLRDIEATLKDYQVAQLLEIQCNGSTICTFFTRKKFLFMILYQKKQQLYLSNCFFMTIHFKLGLIFWVYRLELYG
jgi:hypothetical protein